MRNSRYTTLGYTLVVIGLLTYVVFITREIATMSGSTSTLLSIGGGLLLGGLAAALGGALGARDQRRSRGPESAADETPPRMEAPATRRAPRTAPFPTLRRQP